ncbi:nuclear transport factor 2 family protein [Streptomyces sp. NBC_01198]|uniref:nuclear transport factor 2 family protein n=1 Tax=Streptomyces sp. NBC_01198 TaxID=2903769 RepID=UPI002E0FE6C2|nr:nuclear transport factor 2 family protein [Streptomyces sp. NBC_01198]
MRTARELWESVYTEIDADNAPALFELCAADVEIRTASQHTKGANRLGEMFAQQRGLYDELEHKVDGIIESADGSALSVELSLSGVPKGTDRRLAWNVVETIRADAGHIVSWHAMLDRTGLIQQIRALHG